MRPGGGASGAAGAVGVVFGDGIGGNGDGDGCVGGGVGDCTGGAGGTKLDTTGAVRTDTPSVDEAASAVASWAPIVCDIAAASAASAACTWKSKRTLAAVIVTETRPAATPRTEATLLHISVRRRGEE